jgi:hypothetical protein
MNTTVPQQSSAPVPEGRFSPSRIVAGAKRRLRYWPEDARYLLYRDYLRNPSSEKLFRTRLPKLDAVQSRVVDDLRARGIAFVHFSELFNDAGLWNKLEEQFGQFSNSDRVREGIESYRQQYQDATWKEYLIRRFPEDPTISAKDPWLQLGLNERMLNVVNSYLGLWSKLLHFDLWYNVHLDVERPRISSQRWHRDGEDERLIKVFMYFSDVEEGAGPLQYVPSSISGGRYENLWRKPGNPTHQGYPPQEEFERRVPEGDRVVCTGRAGTIVFADTAGFHRGGFATKQDRKLATWTYVTPASLSPRRFRISDSVANIGLSPEAEYALR